MVHRLVDDTKDVHLIHACDDVRWIVLSMFLTKFWDCCCFTTIPSPADQFTPGNVVRGNQVDILQSGNVVPNNFHFYAK